MMYNGATLHRYGDDALVQSWNCLGEFEGAAYRWHRWGSSTARDRLGTTRVMLARPVYEHSTVFINKQSLYKLCVSYQAFFVRTFALS